LCSSAFKGRPAKTCPKIAAYCAKLAKEASYTAGAKQAGSVASAPVAGVVKMPKLTGMALGDPVAEGVMLHAVETIFTAAILKAFPDAPANGWKGSKVSR
jgi:hypothetical protein